MPEPASPASPPEPGVRARPRWQADLALVLATALAAFAVFSALELNEWMSHTLSRYERWQADELPLTLTVLAAGMAWFGLRRGREAEAELRLRTRADANVAALLHQNRELVRRLMTLQEAERRALARDLHDEVGQACSAIRVELAFIRHCEGAQRDGIGPAAERAEGQALALYTLIHDRLSRLRPINLETLGLVAALQDLCESWEERTGVGCVFHHEGLRQPLGEAVDIVVYRVVQEALTNVARHAQASAVRVRLSFDGAALHLTIHDDGRGFDPARGGGGFGLLGATERAAALGGRLELRTQPGAGVQIALTLPIAASSGAPEATA